MQSRRVLNVSRVTSHLVAAHPLLNVSPSAVGVCAEPLALIKHRGFATTFEGFPFGGGFGGPQAQPPDSDKYYSVLGVGKKADAREIKIAYKKQAMKHHPDRGGDEEKFKEVTRAYEILSNPEKREIYDQYGEEGIKNMESGGGGAGMNVDPFDLFGQMFGFGPGSRGARQQRQVTPDSTYDLQLTLEEIHQGVTRKIAYTRDVICASCNGKGGLEQTQCGRCGGKGMEMTYRQIGPMVQQVRTQCSACGGKGWVVPPHSICRSCGGSCTVKEKKPLVINVQPGEEDGKQFRFAGQADEVPGYETGDVLIVVRCKTHKVFHRRGDNLLMTKTISLSEALCGFQFSTPFLDGSNMVIRSEPGVIVKPGDVMIIKGKGMPILQSERSGDLFLTLEVEFPKAMSQMQRNALLHLLGGNKLSQVPPPLAHTARKLTKWEANRARTFFEAEDQQSDESSGHQHHQQATCNQQ